MAYITANKTASVAPVPPDPEVQVVTDDVQLARGAPERRVDRFLRMAENIVRGLAPPDSEPRSEEYRQAASDAEIAVFEYIFETKGYIKGKSLSGVSSKSYQDDPAVLQIVQDAMGSHAGGAARVFNISPEPLWCAEPSVAADGPWAEQV